MERSGRDRAEARAGRQGRGGPGPGRGPAGSDGSGRRLEEVIDPLRHLLACQRRVSLQQVLCFPACKTGMVPINRRLNEYLLASKLLSILANFKRIQECAAS